MIPDSGNNEAFDESVLQTCAREPIHIPGAIQPHGTLLALREPELVVRQAAENLADHLGIEATEALGKPASAILGGAFVDNLKVVLAGPDVSAANPLHLSFSRFGRNVDFDAVVHRSGAAVVLELEPSARDKEEAYAPFYRRVRDSIGAIQASANVQAACDVAVREIQRISGFARVMAYRFDASWNGAVVAEACEKGMASYRGLHFPASDIPEQARRLYTVNWMRLIPNREYQPARIVPEINPDSTSPLDLSHSILRSVSPVHLEYLKNMGDVQASMSVSVIKDGSLWALIASHHPEERNLSYEVRLACEFIGRLLSQQVSALEIREASVRREALRRSVENAAAMDRQQPFLDALTARPDELLSIGSAAGVAVLARGDLRLIGKTPSEAQVRALLPRVTPAVGEVFHTDHLAAVVPVSEEFDETASGVMAIATTETRETMVLWFRPEVVRTVEWAGNPEKPVAQFSGRIHPRGSFAIWKQTLRRRSLPWDVTNLEAAAEFRNRLVTEELARTNLELAASNRELDNYGYIVSHDLKEPVRGIRNYVSFLRQDHESSLLPEMKSRLEQIVTLTRRMDELLDSLFHYSRLGRVSLSREECDLNDVLRGVLDSLSFTLEAEKVTVNVQKPLPRIVCDRARVGEIFFNLILNGIKYNDSPQKRIEVGWDESSPRVFYVRDNGIGIAEKHRETVFRIFKRLHARDEYGGGTGSGLAIVKRITAMHGGRVWVDSAPGQGSVFYFTLERDDASANH